MSERRYGDDEAREIFALAVETRGEPSLPVSPDRGFSLAELQAIGRQAGIEPQRIAGAARALESGGRLLPTRTSAGMPVSVGRIVDLPRALTDREWEMVVADLRDTFDAPGQVGHQGGAREWRNGNLHVLLEPTEIGQQLRMTTTNVRLMRLNWMSFALLLTAAVFLVVLAPTFADADSWVATIRGLLPTLVVAAGGLGFLGVSAVTLPRWAREREAQMEGIAERVRALADPPP